MKTREFKSRSACYTLLVRWEIWNSVEIKLVPLVLYSLKQEETNRLIVNARGFYRYILFFSPGKSLKADICYGQSWLELQIRNYAKISGITFLLFYRYDGIHLSAEQTYAMTLEYCFYYHWNTIYLQSQSL